MKLIKKAKKGFTLIELVVVIAVIAILVAVSVVSYLSITNKAKESHDNQIIDQVNLSLKANETLNGKPKTMYKALEGLKEDGFLPANFGDLRGTAKDYEFAYSLKENKFVALKKDKISYPEGVGEHEKYELWKIAETTSNLKDNYSHYLRGTSLEGAVDVDAGLDVGDNIGITAINYSNPSGNRNSVIRTNGGTLTINAKQDTVSHYGSADSVVIKDIHSESYHENGEVKFLEVSAGHVVLETEADVSAFHFSATGEGSAAKFENAEGKKISLDLSNVSSDKMPEFSRDPVTIAENGTYVAEVKTDSTEYIWLFGAGIKEQMVVTSTDGAIATGGELKTGVTVGAEDGSVAEQIANPAKRNDAGQLIDEEDNVIDLNEIDLSDSTALDNVAVVEEVASKEDIQTGATEFSGGKGSESSPWLIENVDQIRNIGNHSGDSENHYWKVKDGIKELDCNNWVSVDLKGNFDGNNVILNNLSATLFDDVYSETGKANSIKNFTVNAQVIYDDWNSVVVCYNAAKNTTYENITVHGYLEGSTGVATYVQFGSTGATINFKNCESDLTIVATSGCACGFIAHPYGATSVNLINSHYNGNMSTVYNPNNNNCYVNGNYFTGVTFDEASQRSDVQWDGGYNGHYHYLAEGKTSNLTTKVGTLPNNIGDAIVTEAETGASKAVISLIISPNDINETGCYTQTFISEAAIKDGSFSSDDIKYFNVRVNPQGETESGIHGNNFDIVGSRWGHTLGGNTFVKVTQYDTLGNVICVTTYNFNDAN